ncbi:MAG: NUDIX hydrolase [Candidatus Aenigmarchaeota archaeon]|nr:NUDIX hydrolase [Candidatus Aenigmarchaeota archaeon]
MIHEEAPKNFNPKFSAAGCFCEHDGKIVLLHRHKNKPQGLKWGIPTGKIKSNEIPEKAILRELREETGIKLKKDKIRYFRKVYVRCPEYDFIYHIFHASLPEKADIKIRASEHTDFKWITPKEAINLQLVPDLYDCIMLFYSIKLFTI